MGVRNAWRGLWSGTEDRAAPAQSYTERALSQQLGVAEGGRITPDAIAAVETAIGLYGSVFASAVVEPLDQRTQAITPAILELVGRELARVGNCILRFDIQPGRDLELLPAVSYVVRGSAHPAEWMYSVSLNGPTETRVQDNVPAEGVIHVRLRASAFAPWLGRSPISIASGTSTLAAKIEASLIKEESFAPSKMVFSDLLDEDLSNLIRDIRRGGLTVTGGSDDQSGPTPTTRAPHAVGPDPSVSEVSLRTETAQSVLAMFGIPVSLFGATGDSDARESWRRFILGTMAPMLRIAEAELRAKMSRPELTLSLEGLRAGDLQGRARSTAARALAVKHLVGSGLSLEQAREAAGI